MKIGKRLKGYDRRLFLKGDVTTKYGIRKGENFELNYITFGGITVLFPTDSSALEIKETLDLLRDKLREKLEVEDIYNSI